LHPWRTICHMATTEGFQVSGDAPLNYERHVGLLLGASTEILAHEAGPGPGERALDAACGTGFVARRLLPLVSPGGSVIGIDVNAAMLDVARRFSPQGIMWRAGDLQDLPLEDGSIDVAVCQQGLQYVADPSTALAELHRVLTPGGRLVATVWAGEAASPYHQAQGDAVGDYLDPTARSDRGRAFTLGDENALARLAEEAGFSAVHVRTLLIETRLPRIERFVAQHTSATPRVSRFQELTDSQRSEYVSAVRKALRSFIDGDDVVVPFTHLLLTAAHD
jgi:SAM-dependent methyltransferase